ncbi:hypothetical protein C5E10_03185 [Pseudoclavibacter sp. RFBG4]|uniref:glycosyltransferase family 2 protein n=1 Tax=Pseudoclavibacter sp. RFBG4 TaxID=2080575 RepID=UPI000CE92D57|nr:glycosyltransferase family A protein [Pseudoclavibacter sp. RFBG4]PPG35635.1 hypothetical protein C5E10_03185 [Pseudoclavibacter sp. RFBG4]
MTHSLVSIIVPSRGGARRLPRLIEALRGQDSAQWEAIVVLDGDVDGSEALIEELAGDLPIRSIVFSENRGRSAALNAGFEAASGSILVRCDDDLVPAPNYVSTHISEHERGEAGLIGLYLNVLPTTPYAKIYGRPRDLKFRQTAYTTPVSEQWKYWAGNVSISRSAYDLVGEYDLAFRAYGFEDVDMGYRLHKAGIPVRLVPELETPHYVAAVTTGIRVDRSFHSGAARVKFERKHELDHETGPNQHGFWERATKVAGQRLGRKQLGTLARTVDRLIPVLPAYVSEKCISFLVESASISGAEHATQIDTRI